MIEQQQSDRQLVDTVIAGDQLAFRALIDRESAAVIAMCRRVLGDPAEAEDAAQDAFLQAYRALATFRGDGPFGAWLRRIAIRVAVARLGQAIRRGSFGSVKELVAMIDTFTHQWNAGATPFTWVKTADEILAKAVRKRPATSDSGH